MFPSSMFMSFFVLVYVPDSFSFQESNGWDDHSVADAEEV